MYGADEKGNRIPDFSHCGYAGGEQPIPDVPVRVVVPATPGDSTKRIQKAIDYVANLPPNTDGIRGAVLLLKGRHEVFGGLRIHASGVVLRGQGMGKEGTVLFAAGKDRRTLIRITGDDDRTTRTSPLWRITDAYVPVGASKIQLQGTRGLEVGDTVFVIRPSTQKWIDRLGMTEFGGGHGDFRLTWKPGSRDLTWDRIIRSIEGNRVTLDAPITTAIDAEVGGGELQVYSWPGRINQVGVENIRLESEYDHGNPQDEDHCWMAMTMENARNAWVRQVTAKHFAGSMVAIYENCKWVTVQDCLSFAPVSEPGGYRRNTFFTMGQMTLFLRCYAEYGGHDFSVGHCAAGPNAFVQAESHLPLRDSGPIESWAAGVLFDNVTIDGNALNLWNRGHRQQGAGWSAANCVLWQCDAALIRCYNPPGAHNWAFGSWAEFEGNGLWFQSNEFVSPDFLYAVQLRSRLGVENVEWLELMGRTSSESSNPSLERAQHLAGEARQPARQLRDYIAGAPMRHPVPDDPGRALDVDAIQDHPDSAQLKPASSNLLSITNGWLAVDGKLLNGRIAGVMWWRGNIRPSEVSKFGYGITRFVPGRKGSGYTDDLQELAGTLLTNGQVALDYHYGLWYDRRRDDHQRVRRMNGRVWPPFYEQPFARSGQGVAWDGLSKYDLSRFNPWYWNRLQEFAGHCDRQGTVLFHQNYFQHNILEAGAHWADSPWRSANNINHTDFPEPPPYAGDKRIFMAELFYDVSHPVRRKLHRHYIRQCLENFRSHSNVIQFTSAEFTGPLSFMEFWLDTIAEWQLETQEDSLIALSCTKDVQDAILDDPVRSKLVDIVDFRYWWRTHQGVFAPSGGMNLAPRQFERKWRGGRPTDTDLAQMVSEYRRDHPEKGVICNFDSAGWAFLCAGGSLPRLPQGTDSTLLETVPRMKPWLAQPSQNVWILQEAGKNYLLYSGTEEKVALDFTDESGSFNVYVVDEDQGTVTATGNRIDAGQTTFLKPEKAPAIYWLKNED